MRTVRRAARRAPPRGVFTRLPEEAVSPSGYYVFRHGQAAGGRLVAPRRRPALKTEA